MSQDLDFHPERAEEERRRAEEEQFARRVRREVLRVQSGEAEEDLRADREAEEAEAKARAAEQAQRERRKANPILRLFSGSILVSERLTRNYPYLIRDVSDQHHGHLLVVTPRYTLFASRAGGADAA